MKPYLLVTGDFVKTGGMDRANYALADYLARRGDAVHLVAHRVEAALLNYPNVVWHHVPKVGNSDFLSGFLLDRVGQTWARRIEAEGGRVLVNGGNCQWGDGNWVHYVHAVYPPEIKANLLRQLKTRLAHRYFCYTEKQTIQSARVVFANSTRTKQDLIDHCGIASERIHPIYLGIDPTVFYPATEEQRSTLRQRYHGSPDRPIVLFIGALGDRRKGFDTLFEAWQQLCSDPTWDADLVVIGQGAELPKWQQRSQQIGLESRIQFLGFRQDVPDLLRAADCLVAPTRYEAYGLGIHEALCCGLPTIASANAGVAERYSESLEKLLLSNPSSVSELVNRLNDWKRNALTYKKIVQNEMTVELRNYTWDHMAQQIIASLDQSEKPLQNHSLVELKI